MHPAYAAAQLVTTLFRRRNAAILALADRYVCRLSDRLLTALTAFGANTSARNVRLSAERYEHIWAGRLVVSLDDADLAARRLGEALDGARYLVVPQKQREGLFEVIGYVDSLNRHRHLRVVLKLVPAAGSHPSEDEWWIQTSVPFSSKKLSNWKKRGRLQSL